MDYSAIAMYGLATCIAHYAYSFPREFNGTSLKFLYVPIAFYNACFMPVLSCESRRVEGPEGETEDRQCKKDPY